MNRTITRGLLLALTLLAVLYPLWVRFSNGNWNPDASVMAILFPFFGLIAFSLLWIHAIIGVFEPWLRKQFDFDRFVHVTAIIILISFVLHPLLLLLDLGFNFKNLFSFYDSTYIWLGIAGFLLLITYDIGKFLNRYDFFVRHWRKILVISTTGFFLTLFHSLGLGSDLQTNPLRGVWIFYGVTAFIATIYTYGVRPFLKKDETE